MTQHTPGPWRYVRVHFTGSIRAERGIYLRVTSDTDTALSGYEVDAQGDEIQPRGYERRLRIIAKRAIKHIVEMKMGLTYGTLEEKK